MKTVVTLIALVAFAGSAFAADVMTFSTKGNKEPVSFNHKAHQAKVGDCSKCHASKAGGKIDGFGKAWAHDDAKGCKSCHKAAGGKAPTKCGECHKK